MHGFIRWLSLLRLLRVRHLFALLFGVGVGFYFWSQYPQPRLTTQISGITHGTQWVPGYAIHFTPDGRLLLTISEGPGGLLFRQDGTITITQAPEHPIQMYDVWHGELTSPFQDSISPLAAFSADGSFVATLANDGDGRKHTVKVRDASTGQLKTTTTWSRGPDILQIGFSAKNELMALDSWFRVWDVAQRKLVAALDPVERNPGFPLMEPKTPPARWMADNSNYVALWHEGALKVWHLPTAALQLELPNFGGWNKKYWCRPCLTPDGGVLAWQDASDQQPSSAPIIVMQIASGTRHVFPQQEKISSITLSPDGQTLAVYFVPKQLQEHFFDKPGGIWDYLPTWVPGYPKLPKATTRLFDVSSGNALATLENCTWPIFSPDGKTLAVQTGDSGRLQIWDLPMQKPLWMIIGYGVLTMFLSLLLFRGSVWLRSYGRRKRQA